MKGKQIEGFPSRAEALNRFMNAWDAPVRTELVPLDEACGRVVAQTLYAQTSLPVYRSAACDGICVDSTRFQQGVPDVSSWQRGVEFDRADTGDDFSDDFDAVIAIEEVELTDEGHISSLSSDIEVHAGSNVNPQGSTLQAGDILIEHNLPIRPTDLAALAMGGIAMVPVYAKPCVAFIPTGSELVCAGTKPARGQNIDANSVLVSHALKAMGARPLMFPIIPDTPSQLEHVLDEALAQADVVIINAGSAKGGEDFNTTMLARRGTLVDHYIAAAPGRPMALAVIDHKPVINLPGPTMATFFGLDWCIRAVVNRFLAAPMLQRPRVSATLMSDIHTTPHMAILCRVNVVKTDTGYVCYPLNFHTDSLPVCMGTNGLYVSEIGESLRAQGDTIDVELLRGLEYIPDEQTE